MRHAREELGAVEAGVERRPAFLFEAAGGAATDGTRSILDIEPAKLHARTALVVGSKRDVATFGEFLRGER